MQAQLETVLGPWARAHHVQFDVGPELELDGTERRVAAFVVRLWAVHPKGARPLPGCAKCLDLVASLVKLARGVGVGPATETTVSIEPFLRGLYDSSIVPGTDEVHIAIRIAPSVFGARVGPSQERVLKQVRAQLAGLGIPER